MTTRLKRVLTAALTALATEARSVLSSTLGEQVFTDYQRRDGNWINRLGQVAQRGGRGGGNDGGQDGGRFQRGRR